MQSMDHSGAALSGKDLSSKNFLNFLGGVCNHSSVLPRPAPNSSYYMDRCDHSCYECLGPGERNCSSCVSGYNLEAGACVVSTICKDGELSAFSSPKWSLCVHFLPVYLSQGIYC